MGLWDTIATADWNPFRRKSVILDDQNFLDSLAKAQPVNQEFGDVGSFTDPISRGVKNVARLLDSNRLDPVPQEGRAWYDIFGKIKDAMPDVSATLTKIIILVIIVSVVALFGVSYVNAQANRLALAK